MTKFKSVLSDVVELLQEIRPVFGAVGSRDVDVLERQQRTDSVISRIKLCLGQEPIVKIDCNGDTVDPITHEQKLLDADTELYAHPIPTIEQEQEQEPVAWRAWLDDLQCWSHSCDYHGCGEPLYSHPMPPTEQKPIGYLHANEVSFLSAKGVTTEQAQAEDYNIPLYDHPSTSPVNNNTACISESAESEGQDIELLKQALETMIRAAHPAYVQDDLLREKLIKARDTAFKALETNRLNAKERHRTAKNHTADSKSMVGKKINMCELEGLVFNEMDRRFGLRGEENQYERLRIDDTQLGVEFALQYMTKLMCESDHIPDAGNMV